MQLEDHIGDICRKARLQSKIASHLVANAAKITQAELELFESNGLTLPAMDQLALFDVVKLDQHKAERIAQGWLPDPVDLSTWKELRMITTTENFSVNCFLIWDLESRQAALFDTGWFAAEIIQFVARYQLSLDHLFVTHSHGDHIAAIVDIRRHYPNVQIHSNSLSAPKGQHNIMGAVIQVGRLEVAHRLTPGHAEDSVTYLVNGWPQQKRQVAIVGDAIFAGSMGKDFHTPDIAKQHIREQILSLPSDTLICPGHGPVTTVEEENSHNPFF